MIAVGAVYDANVGPSGPFPQAGNCLDATTAADKITCYSNSGNPLDILAPADCATTTAPGGGYNPCSSGTSAAAPYATGVAAQLLSLKPNTSPSALQAALMTTGRPLTAINGIIRNRIDGVAAYQALGTGGPSICVPDAATLCLNNGRFKIQATYDTGSQSGNAQMVKLTDETGYMFFFSATNVEAVVKVLNACGFNQRFWVFAGGLTDQGVVLTVTDTQNGTAKTYTNIRGQKW